MSKTNKLPYFQINNTKEANKIAKFLLRKIKIQLKDKNHYHYLIFAKKYEYLNFIKENSKKYKYFLKIDIEKYYPCINHSILLDNMNSLPELNTRRMKRCVKKEIPQFLKQGPIIDKGLCIGNFLSWVLAGIYLLPLDYKIQRPFLRIQDDYLIFCKNQNEPQKILKELIEPELKKLELKINILKLKSGKFHQDKVNFLGFNFYAGYFTIHPDKKQEFRKRIIKLTHLTNKKQKQAIIKSINNKILGFGHYYKFASCKRDFKELDAFIRMRLRRWLFKQKQLLPIQGNLILSNETLKTMGLKSLIEIKNKFELKKSRKKRKTDKKEVKSGNNIRNSKSSNFSQLQEIEYSPC